MTCWSRRRHCLAAVLLALVCGPSTAGAQASVLDPEAFILAAGHAKERKGDDGKTSFFSLKLERPPESLAEIIREIRELPKNEEIRETCQSMAGRGETTLSGYQQHARVNLITHGYSGETIACVIHFEFGSSRIQQVSFWKMGKAGLYAIFVVAK